MDVGGDNKKNTVKMRIREYELNMNQVEQKIVQAQTGVELSEHYSYKVIKSTIDHYKILYNDEVQNFVYLILQHPPPSPPSPSTPPAQPASNLSPSKMVELEFRFITETHRNKLHCPPERFHPSSGLSPSDLSRAFSFPEPSSAAGTVGAGRSSCRGQAHPGSHQRTPAGLPQTQLSRISQPSSSRNSEHMAECSPRNGAPASHSPAECSTASQPQTRSYPHNGSESHPDPAPGFSSCGNPTDALNQVAFTPSRTARGYRRARILLLFLLMRLCALKLGNFSHLLPGLPR